MLFWVHYPAKEAMVTTASVESKTEPNQLLFDHVQACHIC
jgi:hypothetical protein